MLTLRWVEYPDSAYHVRQSRFELVARRARRCGHVAGESGLHRDRWGHRLRFTPVGGDDDAGRDAARARVARIERIATDRELGQQLAEVGGPLRAGSYRELLLDAEQTTRLVVMYATEKRDESSRERSGRVHENRRGGRRFGVG